MRYRCGERISTGFVEYTVNQVIAKRFVKKQQMRWTPRGAHLLLQVRVNVLNNDLRNAFQRGHPGLGRPDQGKTRGIALPRIQLVSLLRTLVDSSKTVSILGTGPSAPNGGRSSVRMGVRFDDTIIAVGSPSG